MKQLLARIPESLHREARKLALDEDTTLTKIVEEALTEFLKRKGRHVVDKSEGGANERHRNRD